MLQKDEKYQTKFINILADVFLNSKVNPYFHIVLNLLQFLVVFGILLQEQSFYIKNISFSNNSFLNTLVLLILVLQCIFMVLIGFLLICQKNQKKENVFILQYQGYITKKIKQIVAIFLIIYRKILSLILLQFSLWALKDANQTLQTSWLVSLINLFLMVPFYLLSGMVFASKIAFLPNVISFGYKINIQTLFFTYLPLMIIINSFGSQFMALTNILIVILGLATFFIRPLILYRNNIVGLVGCGMVLGLLTVSGCHKILDIKTQTHQDYMLFFVSSLLIAWIVVRYAQKRMISILLSKVQNTILNKISNWNKDEIIFYYFANYDNEKKSIILYLLQELQRLKQNKITQKKGSQKCILEQQTGYANKELILLVQKIIESLKSTSFKDPSLRKLLNQFLFQKYQTIYNPKNLLEQNLGKNQLKQKIAHTQNLSMILAQILLFDQINLRKCYTFMKIHENLLLKIDNLSFISKIEIHSLIQIVENDLKFKTNSQKGYNLKAQKYFIFQQKYEQLKNLIKNACDQKINFWRQNLHSDPDCHKIHQTIKQNYTIYTKIQSLTFKIADEFPHKGPLILYDLIASYTTKILNIKTFSSANPFYSLIKRYKQQLVNEKRQGLLSQNKTIKKFSLIQNIGVCLVDLQTQEGKILWANEYFWTEFYLHNCKDSQKPKIGENNFVFDVMIPELRFRHKTYFRLFTESQKLNYQHDLSFVYQSDTKIIERVSAQIQIFPSFKNGFNVSVFLFKNQVKQSDCQKFAVLVKEDMSIVGYTGQFLKQKSNLAQEENKTVEINSGNREFLCEQLIKDDIFHDFLQSCRSGDTKRKDQISICVQDTQYKLRVLKVYSLEENVTANIFSSEDLESLQQKQSTCQQVENCIYLLEFEKIKQEKSTDSSEKDIFKTGTTYQQGWMGNDSDIRTNFSQFTSINSNNIERALNKVSERQKNQIQQIDSQKKQNQSQKIQKKYKTLMFKKGSRATCFWMVFTLVVVLILVAAILCNLFIFQNRELLYEDKKLTIKYFNELITDISQLCIALREYNYFAYVNGPYDPRVPLLIDQVKNQQIQISFKLEYLSDYMNQKWTALQILKNGKFNFVLQDQYVVIANYMLSSMTYLSQVSPQQLVFSPFFAEYFGKPLTSAQVNFNEAIFNGIFVVLTNLSSLRAQFLPLILHNITEIEHQIYIYPCTIGFLILLTFLVVSICLQKKSQNLRGNALYLLASVPEKLIRQKISVLEQFKYNNCFILANHLSSTAEEQKNGQIEKMSYKNVTFHMKNLLKATDKYSSNLKQGTKTNQKGSETQNQTKRDLVDMEEIYDLEAPQREKQNQKQMTLSADHKLQDGKNSKKKALKLPLRRMQKCGFLFYVLVIGPSFGYFLAMLLSGFNIDSYMSLSFRMGSQIHNKKTNQQLAFLLTRETFYFQKMKVLEKLDWKNMVMNEISDTLMHDRMLQKLVEENVQAVNLRKLMGRIIHGNLCDEIDKFNGSVYYDVTFSKQECESIESGLLKQGLKPMQNKFLQTAIQIINQVPDPATFTIPQRYEYLKMPELKTMKIILAYLQQLMDIMDTTLQSDLDNQIHSYVQKTRIFSGISIVALAIIFIAVKFRWAIINRHKKEIISILEIVSLQSIKTRPNLNKTFNEMPLKFHN